MTTQTHKPPSRWPPARRTRLVEDLHRFVELHIPQERGQVLEEVNEQLRVHGPALQSSSSSTVRHLCTSKRNQLSEVLLLHTFC